MEVKETQKEIKSLLSNMNINVNAPSVNKHFCFKPIGDSGHFDECVAKIADKAFRAQLVSVYFVC